MKGYLFIFPKCNSTMHIRSLFYLVLSILCAMPAAAQAQQPAPGTLLLLPAAGIQPWGLPVKGVASVLLEYPLRGRFTIAAHSTFGTALSQNSFDIKTNYSILLSQKLGVGLSLSGKRKFARYSFLLLGGIKHLAFKETLEEPELETRTTLSRTTMPDIGLLCGLSLGRGSFCFHTRAYLPFYPFKGYPISTYTSISFEAGIGIRLKRGNKY